MLKWSNLMILVFLLLSTACGDQEGCSDPFAENFDSDVGVDDGSCEYISTIFLGQYEAIQNCSDSTSVMYPLEITLDPDPNSLYPQLNQDILFEADEFNNVKGIVSRGLSGNPDRIAIVGQLVDIPIIGDAVVSGEGVLDNNVLTIEITREYADEDGEFITEFCTIIAQKK